MRVFSIIVLVFLSFLLIILGLYILILRFFFNKAFGKRKLLKRLESKKDLIEKHKIDLCWWEDKKFNEMKIVSEDGLKLYGYYLPQNSDKLAILVHGYGCDYKEMSSYCKMFFNMGYDVFVPQNRGHGKSEGFIGMGGLDKHDILSWINIFISKNPKIKIVLFGLSMGGTTVLMATGEKHPKNVICTISDCAFKNVYNQINYIYNPKNKKLKNIILEHFNRYMKRAYNYDLKLADVKDSLKNSNTPIMIIHGKEDGYVPVQNAYEIYESIPRFKVDSYFPDGVDHAMAYATDPRIYENKIREFLKKWGM